MEGLKALAMIHFMKNVSMLGGLLILLTAGPGRFSVDHRLREREKGR